MAALDRIGIPGGQLAVQGTLETTQVDDPATGRPRRFSDEPLWEHSLDFRQDLPPARLAWGAYYKAQGPRRYFRTDELQLCDINRGGLDLFAETTRIPGVTVRHEVQNLFDRVGVRERCFYPDGRAGGDLDRFELRDQQFGQSYVLRLSGAF